jgi:uncharacterized membrane protein YbaN (DUF454 family)
MSMDGEANPERNGLWRKVGGWFLLVLGLAGCVLPILPGIPFAIAGLIILARDYSWAKTALRKAKRQAVAMRRRARGKRSGQPVTTPR